MREAPLELLILSACETASGDDRAALGLAGVALKAGARSALATLWYINDVASGELVTDFYKALQSGRLSRAQSLRAAQRASGSRLALCTSRLLGAVPPDRQLAVTVLYVAMTKNWIAATLAAITVGLAPSISLAQTRDAPTPSEPTSGERRPSSTNRRFGVSREVV